MRLSCLKRRNTGGAPVPQVHGQAKFRQFSTMTRAGGDLQALQWSDLHVRIPLYARDLEI
jgi:hypothetical protein